jgi:uncharacterized membrane protein
MRVNKWPSDWQLRLIQLLTLPGLIIAFYLLLYHNGDLISACAASGWDDCGKVSGPGAPYSAIGPIPVALIGLIGYATIFLLIWLKDWWPLLDDYLPELMLGITGFAFLFTIGLTALELFVIQAICRFCVISAVFITIMFALALNYLRSFSSEVASSSAQ